MNANELKKSRVQLFRDASSFKKPARVPHLGNVVTWKVFDAGHTLDEAMTDFDVMKECVVHFLDNYPVDALIDFGIRNQFNVTEAFGAGYYYYDKEVVGVRDHHHCTLDTLDAYLDNREKFLWETALPEKYPDFAEKPLPVWQRTFDEYLRYVKFILTMGSLAGKTYGLPGMAPTNPMSGAVSFGIEELLANLLGMKELSMAMRRDPEKIQAFVDRYDETHITPYIEKIRAGKGPNTKYCYDASIMMLAQNLLNPRQFERYYWPHLSALLTAFAEKKMNVRVFTEGSILKYCDYFKDIPKGTVTFHLENDDPFEVRKRLPNVAIMGGMTSALLARGTPEQCVDYARRLICELGADGGFILSEDKMLSYRNDARSENLKAVCEFAASYRL